MFLAIFGTSYESCCSGDDDEDTGWCRLIGGCCLMMFPVAGVDFFAFHFFQFNAISLSLERNKDIDKNPI
jgi:hypothetical protein